MGLRPHCGPQKKKRKKRKEAPASLILRASGHWPQIIGPQGDKELWPMTPARNVRAQHDAFLRAHNEFLVLDEARPKTQGLDLEIAHQMLQDVLVC